MNSLERFALRRPLSFGQVITIVFILLVLISSVVVSALYPADTAEWYLASTVGRLAATFILLVLLALLGWMGSAGFTRPGGWQSWLVCLLGLVYAVPVSAYAVTGNLHFSASDLALAGFAAVFIMVHAFLEETAFRGLVLHAFVRAWGSTSLGLLKGVLASSLLFGGYHLIYILGGEPLPVVLLRVVVGFLLGIFLAALVLGGKSIYPAAFFHGALNFAAYLNLTANAAAGTTASWLWLCLVMLPLAGFGIYWVNSVTVGTMSGKRVSLVPAPEENRRIP